MVAVSESPLRLNHDWRNPKTAVNPSSPPWWLTAQLIDSLQKIMIELFLFFKSYDASGAGAASDRSEASTRRLTRGRNSLRNRISGPTRPENRKRRRKPLKSHETRPKMARPDNPLI
jgi:hypothetical protein